MAAAAFFNHSMTAAQALTGTSASASASQATPADATTTSDSDTSSAAISANDFLTLLVTEMQNQDPTADTDPNEYINQLVNVNSLEQLIDINQNISTALGDSTSSGGATTESSGGASSVTPSAAAATPAILNAHKAGTLAAAQSGLNNASAPGSTQALSSSANHASGNLSVSNASPAAHRVAHALDGRSRMRSSSESSPSTNPSL